VRVRGGAGPPRRLLVQQHPRASAFLVSRGCSSVPRGISGIVRPPWPTPPAKKPRPATSSHPQPTGPPPASLPRPTVPPPDDGLRHGQEEPSRRPNDMFCPCGTASSFTEPFYLSSPRGTTTAWDARSSSSSPELGYGNDLISTPMPAFDWTQANVNIFSHIYLLHCI
jgi:hypothetical protein